MTPAPNPPRSQGHPLLLGCLGALGLVGALAVGGAVLAVRSCDREERERQAREARAAAIEAEANRPRPERAAWPDAGPVVVDIAETPIGPGSGLPASTYLLDLQAGDGGIWQWASVRDACGGECARWAASRGRLFATLRSGELVAFAPSGERQTWLNADAGLYPYGPLAASWDGQVVAHGVRDGSAPQLTLADGGALPSEHLRVCASGPLALSPDGAQLACPPAPAPQGIGLGAAHPEAPSGAKLLLVPTRGPGQTREVPAPWGSELRQLAWSPDGVHLLIIAGTPGQSAKTLWLLDVRTGNAAPLALPTPPPDATGDLHQRAVSASFSPEGTSLLLLSDVEAQCGHPMNPTDCECNPSLYRVGLDGTGLTRLSGPQGCGLVFWLR